jgi:hypothetical protein
MPFFLLLPVTAFAVLIAFCTGMRLRGRRSRTLRLKSGESLAEARLLLTGTFRVYSWFGWVNLTMILGDLLARVAGDSAPPLRPWYVAVHLLVLTIQALLAHALYWRLGFGRERITYMLCHFSGIFVFVELLLAMPREIVPHLLRQEQTTSM